MSAAKEKMMSIIKILPDDKNEDELVEDGLEDLDDDIYEFDEESLLDGFNS